VDLPRSTCYYELAGESPENLALMRAIDEQYLKRPFYGSRKMAEVLGFNRKRIQRLMRLMGIEAIYPRRRTTRPAAGHKIYPYLLRNVAITRPDQVWSTDITYVPMCHGFLYLVAVMDWYSRYVLSWRLSNTIDGGFCLEALDEALCHGRPEIFNSDQGCQFTAVGFTARLESCGIAISRGRWPKIYVVVWNSTRPASRFASNRKVNRPKPNVDRRETNETETSENAPARRTNSLTSRDEHVPP